MPAAKTEAPAKILIPAAAETGTTAIRRVRLAKALAARPTAKIPGMARPPKQAGSDGGKAKKRKPGPHRYKLADEEHAQLSALKDRLQTLGRRVKRGELLRAGLLLLVALSDDQLKSAMDRVGAVASSAALEQQAA